MITKKAIEKDLQLKYKETLRVHLQTTYKKVLNRKKINLNQR